MAEGGEVLRDGTGQMLDGDNQPVPLLQTARSAKVTPRAPQSAAEAAAEARGEAIRLLSIGFYKGWSDFDPFSEPEMSVFHWFLQQNLIDFLSSPPVSGQKYSFSIGFTIGFA